MDIILIELVLWGGLLFFFWALKDGLGSVESEIESAGLLNARGAARETGIRETFAQAESLREPIGSYGGTPIHRYAVIDGQPYQFDRVCPDPKKVHFESEERCLAPGLVYIPCCVELGQETEMAT
ncbi:MAG TPA: hypothetical protein VGU61_13415 [Noviherbaspirillum sp.]|jgi:hypothetical protein|uniref:hypothetical protein n=1 Tax=Noviherbaspirillum sp. TaxID=1926288 RepID=UPI002DDD302A|nr:hypothetical protein [Noviherbaspirillum sp.]HEV2611262.1 hypothetical protein [Noviherbaspirillum sp.]